MLDIYMKEFTSKEGDTIITISKYIYSNTDYS